MSVKRLKGEDDKGEGGSSGFDMLSFDVCVEIFSFMEDANNLRTITKVSKMFQKSSKLYVCGQYKRHEEASDEMFNWALMIMSNVYNMRTRIEASGVDYEVCVKHERLFSIVQKAINTFDVHMTWTNDFMGIDENRDMVIDDQTNANHNFFIRLLRGTDAWLDYDIYTVSDSLYYDASHFRLWTLFGQHCRDAAHAARQFLEERGATNLHREIA
jgi:hypothetical protein